MKLWKVWLETDEEERSTRKACELAGLSGVDNSRSVSNAVVLPS